MLLQRLAPRPTFQTHVKAPCQLHCRAPCMPCSASPAKQQRTTALSGHQPQGEASSAARASAEACFSLRRARRPLLPLPALPLLVPPLPPMLHPGVVSLSLYLPLFPLPLAARPGAALAGVAGSSSEAPEQAAAAAAAALCPAARPCCGWPLVEGPETAALP